jgi:SAM-dependent methyltransferase
VTAAILVKDFDRMRIAGRLSRRSSSPLRPSSGVMIRLGRRVLGPRQLNHLVRFEPVLGLIVQAAPEGGSVLDVGSGTHGITALLGDDFQTTVLDADFTDYGAATRVNAGAANRVTGDVRALPFANHRFDIAVAIDLLEHVPAGDRVRAVSEICRVAERRVVIAFPSGEDAIAADRRLAEDLRAKRRRVPPWLDEHLQHGFPDSLQVASAASRFGSVQVFENQSIASHARLIKAELSPMTGATLRLACRPLERLMASRRSGARSLATTILRRIGGRDQSPTYRAVVTVDKRALRQDPQDTD